MKSKSLAKLDPFYELLVSEVRGGVNSFALHGICPGVTSWLYAWTNTMQYQFVDTSPMYYIYE
jgi:hypothetical protein